MKVLDVLSNENTVCVVPWPRSDPIAGVDGSPSLGAEIGVPGVVPPPDCRREHLTMSVCTRKPTKVRPIVDTGARHEECHRWLRSLDSSRLEGGHWERLSPDKQPPHRQQTQRQGG